MGLSRNKVAVSEGAAGSPPFYGESGRAPRRSSVFGNRQKPFDESFCAYRVSDLAVQFLEIIDLQNPRVAGTALAELATCGKVF